jgi:cobalamin biosynthesis Mg chelatase CobN
MVLWGTDNLKTEGGPIAQALALMGARRASTAMAASRRAADAAGELGRRASTW